MTGIGAINMNGAALNVPAGYTQYGAGAVSGEEATESATMQRSEGSEAAESAQASARLPGALEAYKGQSVDVFA